jgi:hypothetical protein
MKKLFAISVALVALAGCDFLRSVDPELTQCFEGAPKGVSFQELQCKYQALRPVLTESGACEVIRGEKTLGEFLLSLDPALAFQVRDAYDACEQ